MDKGVRKIAIGTLVAGALGYVAGILTAPKSGAETRGSIRSAGGSSFAEAEKQLKHLHTELSHLLGQIADDRQHPTSGQHKSEALEGEIIGKATRAKQKTREIISALHDGNADDRDLDKAVVEATKAIKSIRNYLRK